MQNDLTFKSGLIKQTAGWSLCLFSAVSIVALTYALLTHPENWVLDELLSFAVLIIVLIGFIFLGIRIQRTHWTIEDENIVFHGVLKTKTIPISQIAGFGQLIIVYSLVPLNNVDLYDRNLKIITRLPVSFKDWPKAEAWLAERFRYVVNDGSLALPKCRFADTPKT